MLNNACILVTVILTIIPSNICITKNKYTKFAFCVLYDLIDEHSKKL